MEGPLTTKGAPQFQISPRISATSFCKYDSTSFKKKMQKKNVKIAALWAPRHAMGGTCPLSPSPGCATARAYPKVYKSTTLIPPHKVGLRPELSSVRTGLTGDIVMYTNCRNDRYKTATAIPTSTRLKDRASAPTSSGYPDSRQRRVECESNETEPRIWW